MNIPLHEYLANQIAISGKSQAEIAADLKYKPNVITMLKQGRTKLPIDKVEPLALSLGVDPFHLLKMTLSEYQPNTWAAIESVVGFQVTENERKMIETIRTLTNNQDYALSSVSTKALEKFASALH